MNGWDKIEFEKQWDDLNSDPLVNIYRAATILADSYNEKKCWGLKSFDLDLGLKNRSRYLLKFFISVGPMGMA